MPVENTDYDPLELLTPFRNISAEGKSLLKHGAMCVDCSPPAPILRPGQNVSGAYFVVEGRLRVFAIAPDGTEATLYFINPGETCVFALNSLFNDLRYPAWVQADIQSTVALVPGPVFRELFQKEVAIQDVTVRALSILVFRLMEQLEEVYAYKLDQRLANLMLVHASDAGEVPMTQQQMAHHLGTTREVIARVIREFVAKGMIETGRGIVRIKDADALNDLVTKSS
ncbi:MAG: Crp/Fnr family transcriptional regulator [Deltaproteobacteria bacterium]|nr:Crp/Fnr family transcriptional regulator [Deltaproteobacteria bacterium]